MADRRTTADRPPGENLPTIIDVIREIAGEVEEGRGSALHGLWLRNIAGALERNSVNDSFGYSVFDRRHGEYRHKTDDPRVAVHRQLTTSERSTVLRETNAILGVDCISFREAIDALREDTNWLFNRPDCGAVPPDLMYVAYLTARALCGGDPPPESVTVLLAMSALDEYMIPS